MNEDIEGLLSEHLISKRKDWARKGRIYISDLGSEGCELEMYRKLHDFPRRSPTPGEMLMFHQGQALEDWFATELAEALCVSGEWSLVDRQTSVEVEDVTGKLDVLLRHEKTGDLQVIEAKTKRGAAFKYLDEPKYPNVIQTRAYMMAVDAKYGLLVYIDREGQNFIRTFEVERDDHSVIREIAKLRNLRDNVTTPKSQKPLVSIRRNKGPDSVYLKLPWQVSWCGDASCPCKKSIGNIPDGKIVGKIKDGELVMQSGYEVWEDITRSLLKEADDE